MSKATKMVAALAMAMGFSSVALFNTAQAETNHSVIFKFNTSDLPSTVVSKINFSYSGYTELSNGSKLWMHQSKQLSNGLQVTMTKMPPDVPFKFHAFASGFHAQLGTTVYTNDQSEAENLGKIIPAGTKACTLANDYSAGVYSVTMHALKLSGGTLKGIHVYYLTCDIQKTS